MPTSSDGGWEECLLEDEALGFAQGQLSPEQCKRVLDHLDRCAICERVTNEALHQVGGLRPATAGNGWLSNFAPGVTLAQRYGIRRYIARGGMGEVYEAHDGLLDEVVALKTVVVTASDSSHLQGHLLTEVQLARRVTHPNVCRIHDVHQHALDDGLSLRFTSMQLLSGQTLRQRLRAVLPSFGEVVAMARQLLSGLSAVHRAGVLHCDLKSDNVMVIDGAGAQPTFVIIDFGLARATMEAAHAPRGRTVNGSPPYMAPEQLRGERIGEQADVYAFGVLLFEALTGRLPLGTDRRELFARAGRHEGHAPAPSTVRPGLDPRLDPLVLRCLAADPEARYPSAELARLALERAVGAPIPTRGHRPPRAAPGSTVALGHPTSPAGTADVAHAGPT